MSNPNKRKGTEWETRIVKFLHSFPYLRHAKRHATIGNIDDEGDIHVFPFVIQAKAVRKHDLPGWVSAAREQADRAGHPWSVVFVKKPGRPIEEGYAVRSIAEEARLMAAYAELAASQADTHL